MADQARGRPDAPPGVRPNAPPGVRRVAPAGPSRDVEVAIVGGGPAGAAVAARLAAAGHDVVVLERWAAPRWRASGVYSSPATVRELLALNVPKERVAALVRPIAALEVESTRGGTCRLTYEDPNHAIGIDRVRLEAALLERARLAGAEVHEGTVVRGVRLPSAAQDRDGVELDASTAQGRAAWRARLVIGADGPSSLVARSAGVSGGIPLLRHGAVTVHRADPSAAAPGTAMEARMVVGDGWYCGVTPVPGGRVNVGIVMTAARMQAWLREAGGRPALVDHVVGMVPDRGEAWRRTSPTDEVAAALPLAHRPRRTSGPRFLLVGDAAGFIDPLSGEGIHRALVSARLAAEAVGAWSRGDPRALQDYHRRLRVRFGRKDGVSWILQLFMSQPRLFDYAVRRLGRRDGVRRTFGRAMADLEPPESVLHPRFLAALLAP